MKTRPDGFLLLDKPSDVTSFAALSSVKKRFGTKKVGHAGTLDKFAEGLLIALVGKMTKASGYVTGLSKEYQAHIVFGTETDTLDPEGSVIGKSEHIPDSDTLLESLGRFTGPLEQIPPQFSALHVDGVRAYRLAREGRNVDLKARRVIIHEIELIDYHPPRARLRVVCSKGTYIRSLARDIALSCGSRGHLTGLRRTRIGPFCVDEAAAPDEVFPESLLSPLDVFSRMEGVTVVRVEGPVRLKILHGQQLEEHFFAETGTAEGLNALFDSDENFLALVEKGEKGFSYKFVGARG